MIIRWSSEGYTQVKIAELCKISQSTVNNILKHQVNGEPLSKKHFSGRKKVLTDMEIKKFQGEVEKNRDISGPKLAKKIERETGKKVSPKTAKRYIKAVGLKLAVPRKVPLISEINKKKRLEFAKKFISKPRSYWDKVIWSDETKLNLFSSDGRRWVWRREGEVLENKVTNKTIKHNGGGIMLWGCVNTNGVGTLTEIKGIMNGPKYVTILQRNLIRSASKVGLGTGFIFQQDNDTKHQSKYAKFFFSKTTLQ
jgi:transposase